ncbi:MAG: single-stranded DNA-binding protein [Campylobacterota bacterium]
MYNKVILVGNLTRDVEMRYSQAGLGIAKIGLATNRKYKTQQGEQKEEVCFVDLSMFGRTAEIANQYLKKGSKVLVEGRLVLEQWTDQSGQKRSKHSVTVENMQMLDTKGGSGGGSDDYYAQQGSAQNSYGSGQGGYSQPQSQSQPKKEHIPEIDIDNEEPPF